METKDQNSKPAIAPGKRGRLLKIIAIVVVILITFLVAKRLMQLRQAQMPQQQQREPMVALFEAQERDLAVTREYIGRIEALQSVNIRPQISGEIARVHFKEGSYVRAGQPLFTIDSRQFAAALEARRADLAKAEANLSRASKFYERMKAADPRSVSATAVEAAESDLNQAKAIILEAKAALKIAQINMGYTNITAPISGKIGKANFTRGNFVSPAAGDLAVIVQTNPARVAFSLPDKDYLNQLAEFKKSGDEVYRATLRLANGETMPIEGKRDFEDNRVDPATGTITLRLLFDNSSGLLIPGSMVRVETKPLTPKPALLVPQEAILADSEGDYVFVVDGESKAQVKRVTLGSETGAMREIVSGLVSGDKIIRQGIQFVRPGAAVKIAEENGDKKLTPAEAAKQQGEIGEPSSDNVKGGN